MSRRRAQLAESAQLAQSGQGLGSKSGDSWEFSNRSGGEEGVEKETQDGRRERGGGGGGGQGTGGTKRGQEPRHELQRLLLLRSAVPRRLGLGPRNAKDIPRRGAKMGQFTVGVVCLVPSV